MTVKSYGKDITPLCFLPSGKLICYRYGDILIMNNGKIDKKIPIFRSKKERFLGRSRYLFRLLRMGIRCASAIDEQNLLLSIGNMIYELNLEKGSLSKGFCCGVGIRPLIFTKVEGCSSFEDGIYFGGYLGNRAMQPVHIYRRVDKDKWIIVHTFPEGTINHVHAIVSDSYRDCLWIFTGDFEKAAAIWKVTDNFKHVEYFVGGDQCYRGCVAFAIPEGLLFATDAPYTDNYIYLFHIGTLRMEQLFPIHGSCIYGGLWKNKFVFSSTIEGDGRNMSRLEFIFSRKKGLGIKDNYVHLYVGNRSEGFSEIYKQKKDLMPFFTFQFGVFKFPYGHNKSETLYFQPISTKKYDLNLLGINQQNK